MKLRLPLRLLASLNLLWPALPAAFAQSADDYFHGGAMGYLSNNIPKALEVVTNGRAQFPDDAKLKKLEELLKQQQQQQNQQNQDKKDQQQNKPPEQKKPEQSKPDKQKSSQPQQAKATPGQMTPEQAKRLLDAQKGEEEALVLKPPGKPENPDKPVKDW